MNPAHIHLMLNHFSVLLVGSLLTAGVVVYTANQGRQIRHPEITRIATDPSASDPEEIC